MAYGGWGAFLAGIAGPIAKRVLTAVGVGTVTIVGLQAALDLALNSAKSNLSGLQPVVVDLVAMAGFFDSVSVIAGGLSAAVSIVMLKRLAVLS